MFLILIFILAAMLYIPFMARDRAPLLGLAALLVLVLAHYALTGWLRPTPLDLPILATLGMLALSLFITPDQSLTSPKLTGVLLGAALFYASAQAVNSYRRLSLAVLALVFLSLAVAGLGLVGTDWIDEKVFDLPFIYEALPRWVENAPRSVRFGGIHFNLTGGALAFLVPLLVGLLWDGGGFSLARAFNWQRGSKALKIAYKVLLVIALLAVAFTLLLTQSRGSYLGAAVGVLALAIWKERRFLWALPVLLANGFLALQVFAAGDLGALLASLDYQDGATLIGRFEIWRRAVLLVQDFPLTGTGIGTFGPIVNALYPYFTAGEPNIPHAHNQVLVMATDLGLPGLVLYAALLGGFAAMVIRTWPYAGRLVKAVLAGLAGGMLAHQVFGIMDAFMLGSKLAALFWIYLGLGTALYVHRGRIPGPRPAPRHVKLNWWPHTKAWLWVSLQGFTGWVFFSLLSVAFVYTNTILSLALAVVGGLALGVLLVGVYEDAFLKKAETKLKAEN